MLIIHNLHNVELLKSIHEKCINDYKDILGIEVTEIIETNISHSFRVIEAGKTILFYEVKK